MANLAPPGGWASAKPGGTSEKFVEVFLILVCILILKAIISKQIVRACTNCRVSQQAAFDSFYVIL